MKNAIVYVGKYSPTLMGIQDLTFENDFDDLVFIEKSLSKSKISEGFCKDHFTLNTPEDINSKVLELSNLYEHIYCLSLSYNDTLNLHKIESNNSKITIVGASKQCIEILLNKEKMNEAALSAGLPLLNDINIHDDNLVNHFPLVLRPKNENKATFKAEYINDILSLQHYLTLDVVAQPFISGPNIVIHFANFDGVLDIECFIVKHKFKGVTLTLEKYPMVSHTLITQIESFLKNIKFIGIGHIEFIKNEQTEELYFLDFNGRFGGTSLKAAASGYNEFYKVCSHYMPSIFLKNITGNNLIVSNSLALINCIKTTLINKKDILDYPQKNRFLYILQLLNIFLISKDELRFPNKKIIRDYFYNLFKRKMNR